MDDKNDIYNLDPLEMTQHFLLNLNHKNTYGQYHFDIPYQGRPTTRIPSSKSSRALSKKVSGVVKMLDDLINYACWKRMRRNRKMVWKTDGLSRKR